jgi:hypothetical protein
MNWETISGIAEIIGAAAIVISLIYVAVQVKPSYKMVDDLRNTVTSTSELANCPECYFRIGPWYERDLIPCR